MNGGIIDRAEKGTKAYTEAEIGEQIKLAYAEYQAAQFTGETRTAEQFITERLQQTFASVEDVSVANGKVSAKINGKKYEYDASTGVAGKAITYTAYAVGQEVIVGGESFYVLEASDTSQSTVTLLAKYNLNQEGTVQAPNASYNNTAVAFSSTNYWASVWATYYNSDDDGWDPCPKVSGSPANGWVGSNWTKPLLDLNRESEYDFESNSGDAIYKAKAYATTKGGTNGRLLTYEEADDLKTSYSDMIWGTANQQGEESSKHFLNYWLSSAYQGYDYKLGLVLGSGQFLQFDPHYTSNVYGVRPVITVSKSLIS